MFTLHPRLAADTCWLGDWPLCACLLMNDAQYPWLILVPRQPDCAHVHDLSEADQQQLLRESAWASQVLQQTFDADKINVAALGNVVPQLHWHVVARTTTDAAWPAPIWGRHPPQPYAPDVLAQRQAQLTAALSAPDSPVGPLHR